LLLSLVLIAAMIHFLVASGVVLVFFFLPTLFGLPLWAASHADRLRQRASSFCLPI
jgi:hypothetical protein